MENIFKETIIENRGGTVLFLGRVTNFTAEELSNFLETHGVNYADKYIGQEVSLLVLSTMMTPLEEQTSYDLYDAKTPEVRLAQFEEFYTKHIKPNTLMMSLKLSNDQERLKRLLKNSSFSDEVYLKLFKMYDWGSEGVYENDENRDVTITFVDRFYRPDGFRDPAMVYSPITLSNIARDAKETAIVDAMLTMPNHEIKQSRKEDLRPKNLRELVALNAMISHENIRYLLSFNDGRINSFLACNSAINFKEQEHIYAQANEITKVMMTQNSSLDDKIFVKLLEADDETLKSLLTFQEIDEKRLTYILAKGLSDDVMLHMGENQGISTVIKNLMGLNKKLDYKLASNQLLSSDFLDELYACYGDEFMLPLSGNINLSMLLLLEFYKRGESEILKSMASNKSTPKEILKELCEQNSQEINRCLALNPSVDLFYLEVFALDSELIMLMTQNQTYLDSIVQK
ncbi:MAG: hypothetical protein KAG56_05170 [Sulfurovaceae bacterium]|nr:hypothetical protein [Sulfurovaceae bacterium]